LMTVSMTAYLVSDILKSKPIYEQLLGLILRKQGDTGIPGGKEDKVVMEIAVCLGSQIAGKSVKNVTWPSHCLLVGVKRGGSEIIPRGNTIIYPGDYLIVLTSEDQAGQVRKSLLSMGGEFS